MNKYAYNVYSQWGEDGIIEEILKHLPESDKCCCEFGAWDGERYSNTCNLIRNKGYTGLLIEQDSSRFEELKEKFKDAKVTPLNISIKTKGENCIENILSKTNFKPNFDILSMDIDGNEYLIWKSLNKYQPKIVIVEYNPTIDDHIEFVQKEDELIGNSILSFIKLGETKGYFLAAITDTNLIFIDNKYKSTEHKHPRRTHKYVTSLFQGYNGKNYIIGDTRNVWGNQEIIKNVEVYK